MNAKERKHLDEFNQGLNPWAVLNETNDYATDLEVYDNQQKNRFLTVGDSPSSP